MTQQEQRIALAEWAGWTEVKLRSNNLTGFVPDSVLLDSQGGQDNYYIIPDYPSDLNAWKGLLDRKRLTQTQIVSVLNTLRKLCLERLGIEKVSDFDMLVAVIDHTELLCESLCRVLFPDKWKERV